MLADLYCLHADPNIEYHFNEKEFRKVETASLGRFPCKTLIVCRNITVLYTPKRRYVTERTFSSGIDDGSSFDAAGPLKSFCGSQT